MDCSIEGHCTARIVRSGEKYKQWFLLSEDQKETVSLYILGFASTPEKAIENAKNQAAYDRSMEMYHI